MNRNVVSFPRYGSGKMETQVNRFAGAFLMPKDRFIEKYHEYGGDLYKLASYFEVPIPAVEERARYIIRL
jgi:Zn-dependent peptidase ImmA (M78 family)